jgi:hypothetical protein
VHRHAAVDRVRVEQPRHAADIAAWRGWPGGGMYDAEPTSAISSSRSSERGLSKCATAGRVGAKKRPIASSSTCRCDTFS